MCPRLKKERMYRNMKQMIESSRRGDLQETLRGGGVTSPAPESDHDLCRI